MSNETSLETANVVLDTTIQASIASGTALVASQVVKGSLGSIDLLIDLGGTVGAPVLAATGIGVPLAVLLVLVHQILKKVEQNGEQDKLIKHAMNIVEQCYQLHCLNITRILLFFNAINEVDENKEEHEQILQLCVDKTTIDTIKEKIDSLHNYLKQVVKREEGNYLGKIGISYNRFVRAEWFINHIIRDLTILNSTFILYTNKVNFIISQYEFYLKKNNKEKEIQQTWKNIYKDPSYQSFVTKKTDSGALIHIIENEKMQAETGSNLFQMFKKQTKKYQEKASNRPPPSENGNGNGNSLSSSGGARRQSCCRATRKRKSCIRKDGKRFRLPRKFSKKQCKRRWTLRHTA